jgi:hypothetical protein
MSLSRLAVLCALAATATYSFATDPNAELVASDIGASLKAVRIVPWFTGMHTAHSQLQTDVRPLELWNTGKHRISPGTLSGYTCLKLRTYKVRRQETFSKGESGSVGYSTCQWASKYELRSTVKTKTLQVAPRE